jgi:hypothetical protein
VGARWRGSLDSQHSLAPTSSSTTAALRERLVDLGDGISPMPEKYRLLLGGGTFWPVGRARAGRAVPTAERADLVVARSFWYPIPLTLREQESLMSVAAGEGLSRSNSGAGGGGGYVILSTPTYINNSGTIKIAGGPGGSCNSVSGCGAGGSGANGWSVALTIQ